MPDITRSDVDTVLVSEWKAGSPERQRVLVEAFLAAWEGASWPQGLLSVNLFLSTDGEIVLNYAQWTGDEAYLQLAQTHLQSRVEQIDRAVPGIERTGPATYRLWAQVAPGAQFPRNQIERIQAIPPRAQSDQRVSDRPRRIRRTYVRQ